MTSTFNNTKNAFVEVFDADQHKALLSYLDEMKKDTVWETVDAKHVSFAPLRDVPLEELTIGTEEAREDSMMSEFPIAAVFDDGRKYLIRPYLFQAIKNHHRDCAKVLNEMLAVGAYDDFCAHLNLGRKYLKKKILMMTRGDKISGWFLDFNSAWGQKEQVEFFEKAMISRFPNFKFERAEITHFYSTYTYSLDATLASKELAGCLGIDRSVMAAYEDAWDSAGLPRNELKNAKPICRLITGESGFTSIKIRPSIITEMFGEIPLGEGFSVIHKTKDDTLWEKFKTFPSQVATFYQDGLKNLDALCSHVIFHPYNAVTHVLCLFNPSVPVEVRKNCAMAAGYRWNVYDAEATCTAIEIYNMVTEYVQDANERLKPVPRLYNIEMLGRLLGMDWNNFDQLTAGNFGGRKTAATSAFAEGFGVA